MDIKLNIQTVANRKGITTAYQLQKALDAYPSEAAKLWKGEVKQLSLAMMSRLCDALECNPCDLLVRTEEGAAESDQVDQVQTKPVKARSAKSLTEAEKKRIRDAQQARWLESVPGKKATKKGGKK